MKSMLIAVLLLFSAPVSVLASFRQHARHQQGMLMVSIGV